MIANHCQDKKPLPVTFNTDPREGRDISPMQRQNKAVRGSNVRNREKPVVD